MFDNCIILAGGSGTRLWPVSNSRMPKQFLPVSGKDSFFTSSLKRALSVINKNGSVIIITSKTFIPIVIHEASKFTDIERKRFLVIGEPMPKNTAPAIACVLTYLRLTTHDRSVLVLTSDHIIKPLKTFKSNTLLALSSVKKDQLAVFGIKPAFPETGYGYIETNKTVSNTANIVSFHEKPDYPTAKKYLKSKHFFWNSGMFAFSTDFMIKEFCNLSPGVFTPFKKLKAPKAEYYTFSHGVRILYSWPGLLIAYRKTKNISFDYAIAEKCSKITMILAEFEWSDVGNWEEYSKLCGTGTNTSVYRVSENSCFVDSDIPVALAGVDDLIIVIRSGKNGFPAAALITKKGQTQKVREIVEQIKSSGNIEIL